MAQGGACAQSEAKRASLPAEPAEGMKNPIPRPPPRLFASREADDASKSKIFFTNRARYDFSGLG